MLDELYIINSGKILVDTWRQVEDEENDDMIDVLILLYLLYKRNYYDKTRKIYDAIGKYYAKSERRIKREIIKSKSIIREEIAKSAVESNKNDYLDIYNPNNINKPNLSDYDDTEDIVKDNYNKTVNEIKRNTSNVPENMKRELYKATNEFNFDVEIINIDPIDAIIRQIEELTDTGSYLFINNGNRKALIGADIKRVIQTAVNHTAAEITLLTAQQNGFDYVLVSAHIGARVNPLNPIADHAGWQGKPYKIKGYDDYADNLEEKTGYPTNPLGLLGYNCRHSFSPHKKGMEDPYKEYTVKQYADSYKKIKYQRELERRIRLTKRKVVAFSKFNDNIPNTKIKTKLDHYTTLARKQLADYKKYCAKHSLPVSEFNLKL